MAWALTATPRNLNNTIAIGALIYVKTRFFKQQSRRRSQHLTALPSSPKVPMGGTRWVVERAVK
jgi:hypothetical protein